MRPGRLPCATRAADRKPLGEAPNSSPDAGTGLQDGAISWGGPKHLREGGDVPLIFGLGAGVQMALERGLGIARRTGRERDGHQRPLLQAAGCRNHSPCRISPLRFGCDNWRTASRKGGFGSAVLELLAERDAHSFRPAIIGLPDHFVEHGPVPYPASSWPA